MEITEVKIEGLLKDEKGYFFPMKGYHEGRFISEMRIDASDNSEELSECLENVKTSVYEDPYFTKTEVWEDGRYFVSKDVQNLKELIFELLWLEEFSVMPSYCAEIAREEDVTFLHFWFETAKEELIDFGAYRIDGTNQFNLYTWTTHYNNEEVIMIHLTEETCPFYKEIMEIVHSPKYRLRLLF